MEAPNAQKEFMIMKKMKKKIMMILIACFSKNLKNLVILTHRMDILIELLVKDYFLFPNLLILVNLEHL